MGERSDFVGGHPRGKLVSMQRSVEHSGNLRVDVPALGRYLAIEEHVVELTHFMGSAGASVGSFAEAFQWPKLKAYRKVQSLLNMGLLIVVKEERRAGKPIKLYHCPYQTFFIPSRVVSLTELLDGRRYDARMYTALEQTLDNMGIAGMTISIETGGQVQMLLVDTGQQPVDPSLPDKTALLFSSGEMTLDFASAKAFQKELLEVIQRYHSSGGSGRYQYQIVLTPDLISRESNFPTKKD